MRAERPFFQGSDTSFGIVYPIRDLSATFESRAAVETAEKVLHAAGPPADDVETGDADYVNIDVKTRLTDAG